VAEELRTPTLITVGARVRSRLTSRPPTSTCLGVTFIFAGGSQIQLGRKRRGPAFGLVAAFTDERQAICATLDPNQGAGPLSMLCGCL